MFKKKSRSFKNEKYLALLNYSALISFQCRRAMADYNATNNSLTKVVKKRLMTYN